jgi:hypothetical protein
MANTKMMSGQKDMEAEKEKLRKANEEMANESRIRSEEKGRHICSLCLKISD